MVIHTMFDIALPEITLAIIALLALVVGLFSTKSEVATSRSRFITIAGLLCVFMMVCNHDMERITGLNGFYIHDAFADFIKLLLLIGTAACIYMSHDFFVRVDCNRFEIPVLYSLATLGAMVMISANDFLPLYLGVELQALSIYTLVAIRRDSQITSEAGLKYFVLGALSSGFILYGISLMYGYTGTTQFDSLTQTFVGGGELAQANIGVLMALVFIFAGLAFKLSAAPFHMWTPDVYQGASTPVVAYMASVSKVAALGVALRIMANPLNGLSVDYIQIVVVLSVLSMFVGSFGGLVQVDLKRLMGYSAIANIGFVLLAMMTLKEHSITAALLYILIYAVSALGIFAVILTMRQKDRLVSEISDLQGIATTHPLLGVCMAVLLFSAAGIPPMAGFLAKFFVFEAAIEEGYYTLSIIGVILSVISAYYYLRIIRIMYMDEPVQEFDTPLPKEPFAVAIIASLFVFFFIFIPETILGMITDVAILFING